LRAFSKILFLLEKVSVEEKAKEKNSTLKKLKDENESQSEDGEIENIFSEDNKSESKKDDSELSGLVLTDKKIGKEKNLLKLSLYRKFCLLSLPSSVRLIISPIITFCLLNLNTRYNHIYIFLFHSFL
jgi:hypothetical protein